MGTQIKCPKCGNLRWRRAVKNYKCIKCGDASLIKNKKAKPETADSQDEFLKDIETEISAKK